LSVPGPVEREPGEQDRRNGVRCAAADLRRKLRTDDQVGREAAIRDDNLVSGCQTKVRADRIDWAWPCGQR
jgi:hypothetical protein